MKDNNYRDNDNDKENGVDKDLKKYFKGNNNKKRNNKNRDNRIIFETTRMNQ